MKNSVQLKHKAKLGLSPQLPIVALHFLFSFSGVSTNKDINANVSTFHYVQF